MGDYIAIKAKDGGIIIHFEKRLFRSRHTLTEVENLLGRRGFLRIHRSMIVNRARIRSVEPLWKGEYKLRLTTGASVVSGRTYQAAIEDFLRWA
jgi:DNA-binding LytR/AlgR family response regulator